MSAKIQWCKSWTIRFSSERHHVFTNPVLIFVTQNCNYAAAIKCFQGVVWVEEKWQRFNCGHATEWVYGRIKSLPSFTKQQTNNIWMISDIQVETTNKQTHQNTQGSHTACNSYSSLSGFPCNVLVTQHGHHRDLKEDGVGGAQFSELSRIIFVGLRKNRKRPCSLFNSVASSLGTDKTA